MTFIARRPKPGSLRWTLSLADRLAYAISCLIVGGMGVVAVGAYVCMVLHIEW